MNRAKATNVVLRALFFVLLLLSASCLVSAQVNRARAPKGGATQTKTNTPQLTRAATGPHPFSGPNLAQLPKGITLGKYKPKGRAPGDFSVIKQTTLLSKLDPSAQNAIAPAPSQDEHPFATNDEKYIYFDSDRGDDSTTPQVSTGHFNIFRMFLDGSGVTQITTGTDNKIEPSVSSDGSRVAYAAGGSYSNLASNLDNPPSSGFNLFYVDLTSGGNPVALTRPNASNLSFLDVRHPSWAPGGDKITFAGRVSTDPTHYHIFLVDIQSVRITQLTAGPSNDYAPAWSPDGNLIAFTTNAGGYNPGSGPIQASSVVANDDIYVMTPIVLTPNPKRVTNFSVPGKGQSSNKNPAWSTLRPDPLNLVPPETNANGDPISSFNLLAFASNRADTNHDGVANDIRSTFEIYWLHASIKPDPVIQGSFTVVTPEASGNPALKLRTSTPDTAIDPNDPTSMFDPNFISNEDYPTWPQYISSYRIFFQSDRGPNAGTLSTNLNIWGSTILDINSPTLLKYDIPNNEIVHIGREVTGNPGASNISVRQVDAGETLRFKVRVVDYESGVEPGGVYIQIKNPNSQPKSADNKEHKVFFSSNPAIDTNIAAINAPFEFESQAINPNSYDFRSDGQIPDALKFFFAIPGNWPGWNQYVAGISDATALSGSNNMPDDDAHDYTNQGGFWLQMWDDGPISAGGHEPEGEISGDGIFTTIWTTPSALPSDWYIDIIVRDMGVDPFAPTERTNWKIYDNVWGFSTLPFRGEGNFLYVNDYASGQKFFQTRFGSGTQFGSFSGTPTESWMTEIDPALQPVSAINGTTVVPLLNVLTPLGANSYGIGGFNEDPTTQDGTSIPVTGRYDIWRILSRGPIPDSVLNGYRATIQTQPADVLAGGTGPRQVTVAERAIIWHAPYPGDLFVGPGTILDTDTQLRLSSFVRQGGRLFVNGEDVAFGLTLGGGGVNSFLNSVLHATYVGDFVGDWIITPVTTPGPRGFHPLVSESYYNLIEHSYPTPPGPPNDPPHTGPLYLRTPMSGTPARSYGCLNQASPDQVNFNADVNTPDKSAVDAFFAGASNGNSVTTTPAIMWFTDSTQTPIVSKIVFMPFGAEAINPEYFTAGTAIVLKNRRVEILHNIGDYLRTGRIIGNVRDVSGATPLSRVFIRALSTDPNLPANTVVATTFSQGDGSYVLNGLDANGLYQIDAFKKGFITLHAQANFFHGGWQSRTDLFLTQAQAGSISGTVTIAGTTNPAPGVIVVATDKVTGDVFTATTNVQGKYTINNVPASIYVVTTPLTAPGNLAALGYGSSIPPSYGGPETGALPAVTVTPGQNVTGIDFMLKAVPGRVLGKVTDATTGLPIAGAVVTATTGAGTVFTATTATDGTYIITGVDPGNYVVVATAPGYAANVGINIVVNTNQDTINVDIALQPVAPGSLSGLVQTSTGIPIGGATVTVTNLSGTVIATTTTGTVQTINGYTFNYKFTNNIPAGAKVVVSASKSGFTTKTAPLTVGPINPGQETQGVNFILDPLHSFTNGLSLVSAPYEYSGIANSNVADLLSIPSADRANGNFAFITWNPANPPITPPGYVSFPTPPADTFHLGRGYFLQERNTAIALALTTQGTPANGGDFTRPFNIQLQTGWNLIGDPFPFSLNFLNLKVQEANGSITDVLSAQSGSNPSLGAALWTYENGVYQVVFTVDAYRGYWIRAFRPVTLIVDPAAGQGRAVATDSQSILTGNAQSSGWKLQLMATAGDKRSAPGILGTHPAATNNYDRFKLESPPVVGPQNVQLTFEHPEWTGKTGQYSVDVRSVAATSQKWTFTVTSTVPNEPVVVNWPALATVSSKYDLFLTDLDAQTTVNLRTSGGYTIPANRAAGNLTRHFSIEARRATRPTLALQNVNAIVNRSGDGSRAASSAAIYYTVTADATVQVSIMQNGRRIRSVEQGVTRAAGTAQVLWDMRNDQGSQVPGNIYTVEVRAKDAQGHTVRQETPLLITR